MKFPLILKICFLGLCENNVCSRQYVLKAALKANIVTFSECSGYFWFSLIWKKKLVSKLNLQVIVTNPIASFFPLKSLVLCNILFI